MKPRITYRMGSDQGRPGKQYMWLHPDSYWLAKALKLWLGGILVGQRRKL